MARKKTTKADAGPGLFTDHELGVEPLTEGAKRAFRVLKLIKQLENAYTEIQANDFSELKLKQLPELTGSSPAATNLDTLERWPKVLEKVGNSVAAFANSIKEAEGQE